MEGAFTNTSTSVSWESWFPSTLFSSTSECLRHLWSADSTSSLTSGYLHLHPVGPLALLNSKALYCPLVFGCNKNQKSTSVCE